MTFRDKIATDIREAEQQSPAHYIGGDWWQLLPEEAFVFDIDEARWPCMMTAWSAYEVFLDVVAPEDYQFTPAAVEAERQAQPALVEKGNCIGGFQEFAALYAGLTFREAAATHDKMNYSGVREGTVYYADEPAPEE